MHRLEFTPREIDYVLNSIHRQATGEGGVRAIKCGLMTIGDPAGGTYQIPQILVVSTNDPTIYLKDPSRGTSFTLLFTFSGRSLILAALERVVGGCRRNFDLVRFEGVEDNPASAEIYAVPKERAQVPLVNTEDDAEATLPLFGGRHVEDQHPNTPRCDVCSSAMVRNGTVFKCHNCGNTMQPQEENGGL